MVENSSEDQAERSGNEEVAPISVKPARRRQILWLGGLLGAAGGAALGYVAELVILTSIPLVPPIALGSLGAVLGAVVAQVTTTALNSRGAEPPVRALSRVAPAKRGAIPTKIEGFIGRTAVQSSMMNFYRSKGSGTCLLLGLGGCGKSATVEKFFSDRGWASRRWKKGDPDALLICTFYRNTDVNEFLSWVFSILSPMFTQEVIDRFEREQGGYNPLDLADILKMINKKFVFVLDGLERIQEEKGSRFQAHGSINNPALRQLLQRAAQGDCGNAKFYLTSRVDIPELSSFASGRAIKHDLNMMTPTDAASVLRSGGVRGTDPQIDDVCAEYKYHAYSLRLVAAALTKHFRSDARQHVTIPEVKGDTMARILHWYAEKLSAEQEAILKAASAFREATSFNSVRDLVRAMPNGRPEISDAVFKVLVDELSDASLVFCEAINPGMPSELDLHPIVRDFFYKRLLNPQGVHETAWSQLSKLSTGTPGASPTDPGEVSAFVELIYHAVQSGHVEEAWKIYRNTLGGYRHLGNRLGDHPKGSKAIDTLLRSEFVNDVLQPAQKLRLRVDGALYLKNEGRLEDAIEFLSEAKGYALSNEGDLSEAVSIVDNLAGIQNLRGWTGDAIESATLAVKLVKRMRSEAPVEMNDEQRFELDRAAKESGSRLATALALRGDLSALDMYQELQEIPNRKTHAPRELLELRYAWLLNQIGRYNEATAILDAVHPLIVEADNRMILARWNFYRAQVDLAQNDVSSARAKLKLLNEWATRVDLEMLGATLLLTGQCYSFERNFDAATSPLFDGTNLAADNGLGIYWLEFQLWRAGALNQLGKKDESVKLLKECLDGNPNDYVFAMIGARDKRVAYRWAVADAAALLSQLTTDRTKADGLWSEAENAVKETGYKSLFGSMHLSKRPAL